MHLWPPRPRDYPSKWAANATGTTASPGYGTAPSRSTPSSVLVTQKRQQPSSRGLGIVFASRRVGASGPLNIMYRIDGSSDLVEETLDHFEGYQGSKPVRIGNGAADQLQLDIYGEAMDSIYLADKQGLRVGHQGWEELKAVLDWLCNEWDQPDEGVWETRGGRQNFTYGRLMSWVAFDRAIRLAQGHGRPADIDRWRTERDRVYDQIVTKGWSMKRRAFVQHYDTDVLDASLLLMPLMDFVAPKDPQWLSTLEAIDQELVSDSLVYRYDPSASPDGLLGSEGTFSICTFWYVDALARSGRLEEAALTFEKMMTYANHLGLFSEEIGATGEQLGNFPQAFSHLSDQRGHQLGLPARSRFWGRSGPRSGPRSDEVVMEASP